MILAAPATRRNRLAIVKSFVRWAIDERGLGGESRSRRVRDPPASRSEAADESGDDPLLVQASARASRPSGFDETDLGRRPICSLVLDSAYALVADLLKRTITCFLSSWRRSVPSRPIEGTPTDPPPPGRTRRMVTPEKNVANCGKAVNNVLDRVGLVE